MAKIILGLTLSLDGCSTDRHGSVAPFCPNPAPYKGVAALHASPVLQESIANTGAVVIDWPGGGTHLRYRVVK
jgi:hypothetical protein